MGTIERAMGFCFGMGNLDRCRTVLVLFTTRPLPGRVTPAGTCVPHL